jgi:hypothetical protein
MVCPPIETGDVTEQVAAALQGLPVLERRVVELHHYQHKTISQTAKELGICRPWTSRLHARALAALRVALEGKSLPYRPNGEAPERPTIGIAGRSAKESPGEAGGPSS